MMGAENSPLYPGYPYSKYDTITGLESAQYLADYLIAPPLAGWMVHGILYGSLISEMNRYRTSTSFKASSREKKVLIWVIVGLESINMSMSFGQSMHYGTTQDRTTLNLLTGSFSLDSASFLLGGLIAMLVQMTLARRCASLFLWREKERKLFQVVVFTLSVMAFMAVFSVFVLYALYLNNLSVQNGGYLTNILTSVWAFLSAAVDTTITISLVLILRKQVQGFNPEVDDVVTKIIKLGLETGAATTVGAILCAILSLVFPADDLRGANLGTSVSYSLPALYVLSLLSTLQIQGRRLSRSVPTTLPPAPFPSFVAGPHPKTPKALEQGVTTQARQIEGLGHASSSGEAGEDPLSFSRSMGSLDASRLRTPQMIEEGGSGNIT